VLVPTGATTGSVVVTANGMASNAVPFTVMAAAPSISSVSPDTGTAGTQVTISGSNFGSAQGAGQVWLGSRPGTVISWSDTQVVATVALGSSSGGARVQQGNAWSNSVPFTVNTATIANVTPSSGAPGTEVTITGSYFGAEQGAGQVWLGAANGEVVSWSDTQIVAQVAAGSASGKVQVLQNGVWSNALPFDVDSLHLASISPDSGGPGTAVTLTGTGFGASQGTGTVWLGSTEGQVLSWSNTEVVAAVAPTALTGIVRVRQNDAWSNALAFTVPSGGQAATLAPNLITMLVGDTHEIQALDADSHPVTGLTWTSSDPNVVNLSTDDPPLLSALAPGHVTITAGGASADVTVTLGDPNAPGTLPVGTVLWSVPGNVDSIVPAVPSPDGVADVFAFSTTGNGYSVQAITSEGKVAWTANVGWAWPVLADFQGGLVYLSEDGSIVRLDGATGLQAFTYTPVSTSWIESGRIAVHTDGTVFAVQTNLVGELTEERAVIGLDPATGARKFSVPIPLGDDNWAFVDGPMIAGDGYAYVSSRYSGSDELYHLDLLRVDSDGAHAVIPISAAAFLGCEPDVFYPEMFTNADQGILLTWVTTDRVQDPYTLHAALVSGGGVTRVTPPTLDGVSRATPVLQAQDGSFIGYGYNLGQDVMVAFDAAGAIRWSVPGYYDPLIATADGGVIATDANGSAVKFDQYGSAIEQMAELPTYSWIAGAYAATGGSASAVEQAPPQWASSFAAVFGGNPSWNITFVPFLTWHEGVAVWGGERGPKCRRDKPDIYQVELGGDTRQQYDNLKNALLAGGYLESLPCWTFFNEDQTRATYWGQLPGAVTSQAPWDGTHSTINMYAAGLWTEDDVTNKYFPVQWKKTPVCANFQDLPGKNPTVAMAQAWGIDVYINTKTSIRKRYLRQSTIVHEALHNLTGRSDPKLFQLLGITPELIESLGLTEAVNRGATNVINVVLDLHGCAAN
jgi:hypothetical protein